MGFGRPTDGTSFCRSRETGYRTYLSRRVSAGSRAIAQPSLQTVQLNLVQNWPPRWCIVTVRQGLWSGRIGKDTIKPDRIEPGVCITERDRVTGHGSDNNICPTEEIGC